MREGEGRRRETGGEEKEGNESTSVISTNCSVHTTIYATRSALHVFAWHTLVANYDNRWP